MHEQQPEICEVCGKGANDPGPLYRKNRKGEPAVWRCNPCFDVEPVQAEAATSE